MTLVWGIIVAVILVAVLYVLVHRMLINRATIMLRNDAQATTDNAMNEVLSELLKQPQQLKSEIVADVWGKGVLAFEYYIDYRRLKIDLTGSEFNRQLIENYLNQYAQNHQVRSLPGAKRTFVVSDWWTYEGRLHIDVSYVLNEATKEYVADLKRLGEHDQ